jgi:transposase
MSENKVYVGVDIAKATLAVCLFSQHFDFANTEAGFAALIEKLRTVAVSIQVVCEATGGYERALVVALHDAGFSVSVLNPRRVRNYARARNSLAKTDKVDARILADYGATLRPAPTIVPTPSQRVLAELVSARQDLVEQATAEGNRLEHLTVPALIRDCKTALRRLAKRLKTVDALIDKQIQADPVLSAKAARLDSVVGVGRVTIVTVLALMPELGHIDRGQAAALAGVAPYTRDSGQYSGKRRIHGGRPAVRRVLYMAAVSASNHNQILSAYYQALRSRGKPAKVAFTAIMRKLIVLLNHLLKDPSFVLAGRHRCYYRGSCRFPLQRRSR